MLRDLNDAASICHNPPNLFSIFLKSNFFMFGLERDEPNSFELSSMNHKTSYVIDGGMAEH